MGLKTALRPRLHPCKHHYCYRNQRSKYTVTAFAKLAYLSTLITGGRSFQDTSLGTHLRNAVHSYRRTDSSDK